MADVWSGVVAIATTAPGLTTLGPLCNTTGAPLWLPRSLLAAAQEVAPATDLHAYDGSLKAVVAQLWPRQAGFVFALASGAVVRLIAPLLADKATDPAVVVVDATGQHAISLCGGHQGGADALARQVAAHLSGTAVITGASSGLGLPAVDLLGQPFGWHQGSGDWTAVAAAVANQQPVQILQEAGSTLWQKSLPSEHPFQLGWPEHTADTRADGPNPAARVWISPVQRRFAPGQPKAQWHPKVLWLGLGCERHSDPALVAWAVEQTLERHHLAVAAVAGVASLELKADEPGLLQLCEAHGWPLRCFSAAQLQGVAVPNPSAVVAAAVGTPSVAEAAALTAALTAASQAELRVPKQVLRHPDYAGAVTVAVAEAEQETIGKPGSLVLVGTGPGSLSQITPAARSALAQAEVVIGYGLYVELVRPLLQPGQMVETWSLTQERQRAERAIELARWGLRVAVISSGDCGIYGMAGLVLELLATDWDGQSPAVEVVPGISALQAAAARVGAPLMHDFCAISLSDLLTPWPVIRQRLRAAAAADFVVALYNPKSKTRTWQIEAAQELLLAHRAPHTPVALVRSAYRADEQIRLTTLADMLSHPVDMLTTVLIGNSSTRLSCDRMITPRGYLGLDPGA